MNLLQLFDLFGVFVFALSGALLAARKDMDIFGFIVLGLLPAIGGGTLRDLVLDAEVFWIRDPSALWVAMLAAALTYFGANRVESRLRLMLWADAFGLALFAVSGAQKALELSASWLVAIILGVVTGLAGGMIRDVVANEIPLILKQEVYATVAFVGAACYVLLASFWSADIAFVTGVISAFLIRASALIWDWSLPQRRQRPPNQV